MLGSTPQKAIKPNWVAEPVRWYTQMPSAKPVSEEPRKETSRPNQMMLKIHIPRTAGHSSTL
jgi:hypothetical protein